MFTDTVNTDLGELIDCDCLHQDSEQRERAGEGQLNPSTCLGITKWRKHTHVSSEDISLCKHAIIRSSGRQLKTRQRSLGLVLGQSWCVSWPDTWQLHHVNAIKPDAGPWARRVSQEIPGNKNILVNKKYQEFLTFGIKFHSEQEMKLCLSFNYNFCPLHFCPVPGRGLEMHADILKNSTSWNPTRVNSWAKWAKRCMCYVITQPCLTLKHIYKCEQMPPMCNVHGNWG